MRRLLWMLLLLAVLIAGAQAAPDTPYDIRTAIAYGELPPAVQATADIIYDGILRHQARITFPDMPLQDVVAAMNVIEADFPELIMLPGGYRYSTQFVELDYTMSADEARSSCAALLNRAHAIVAQAEGTAEQRERFFHDYLIEHVRYGFGTDDSCHHAGGALINGECVCEGYADAMTLLCRLAGIPCSIVSGTANNGTHVDDHAWNVIELDGKRVQTDVTWDDNMHSDMPVYWYYNLSASQMGLDHSAEDWHTGGMDTAGMDWYSSHGWTATSNEDAQDILLRQLPQTLSQGTPIHIKFLGGADMDWLTDCLGEIIGAHAGLHDVSYAWTYSPDKRFMMLTIQ